ncbi:hypothetical protein DFH09DRAFT_1165135 [Mycena vulgaris]|nr:hypothetical protein DFH09DRAFT_1165135 [Mycena vulgaris]
MGQRARPARIECRSRMTIDDGLGADRLREHEFAHDYDQDQDQHQRKTSTGTGRADGCPSSGTLRGAEGIRDSTRHPAGELEHGSVDGRRCRMCGEVLIGRRGGGNCRPPPVAPLVANVELGKWRWQVRDWEALSGGWANHRESEERSASACFFPRPPRGAFVEDATCALVRCDLRPRRACASLARLYITPPPS